jgi:hypothetical protein
LKDISIILYSTSLPLDFCFVPSKFDKFIESKKDQVKKQPTWLALTRTTFLSSSFATKVPSHALA